ncbi:MAG: N-acetylmuramoyl-L-alanine amidase [Elusimicrobium sp.]|jgi:N-acetylmuramoyl-L-alanine amidase|nr:N-acetylmuramoyl-L-alanine amidase [Elusimicrobium sp.]
MKKKFIFLFLFLFAFFSCGFAELYFFDSGKEKGQIPSYSKQEFLFVDAQALTKKLGGESTVLSQSRQLRIKINSFTSFITAGRKEILINGVRAVLPVEAEISGSQIYVPIELFTNQKLGDALGRQIIYSDGKYTLEDFFNIEYIGEKSEEGACTLFFQPRENIKFNAVQKNRGVVEVELQQSVLKRQGSTRIKDNLINNFTARKCGRNECLRFLMTPAAKDWKFEERDGFLVFKAFSSGGPEISAAQPAGGEGVTEDEGEILSSSKFFDSAKPVVAAAAVNPTNSDPAAAPIPVKTDKKKMRIMVDPGHGGKDPGAVRRLSAAEKDINLSIAKELYANLKKQGYDVRMTRDDDTFLALNQRSKLANDFNADLFVSIHVNTAPRTTAQGVEVYFRSEKATDTQAAETAAFENEALQYEETHFNFADMLLRSLAVNEYVNESSKLAGHLRNSLKSTSGTGIPIMPGSSIKQANFYVLKGVDAPAVLIESGYMSNPSDRKQLNNKNVRAKIAEGVSRGISAYAKAEGWQ